jgi:hypothetical protein
MKPVIGGKYLHYKGNYYRIIGIAKHSETLEELVVYQALYGDGLIWVRPVSMFFDTLIINGEAKRRFQYILEV